MFTGTIEMPQIWLTYDEMGRFLDTSAEQARLNAIEARLDRRQCSDGYSRIKLPADMVSGYLLHAIAEQSAVSGHGQPLDTLADQLVGRLRTVASRLAMPGLRRVS